MNSLPLLLLTIAPLLSAPPHSESPRKCALLVGINHYGAPFTPAVKAPHQWSPLKGTHNDVKAMAEVLSKRYGFEVRTLFDKDATREGIRRAFDTHLMQCVRKKDDVALFHFSGHGQQIDDPDGDESDGADESLIPYDNLGTRNPAGNIRDDEFEQWLKRLRQRTDNVVVSMDSCHSGDATRSGSTARGIASAHSARQTATKQAPGGWTDANLDYVFLAAADSDERAYESEAKSCTDSREGCTMGRFTQALVKGLWTASPRLTYVELIAQVRHSMLETNRGHHPHQSPQIVGQRQRRLFSTNRAADAVRSYAVSKQRGKTDITIDAGLIHGLSLGSVIAVYESDADIASKASPLARVRIERIGATTASGPAFYIRDPDGAFAKTRRGVEEFSQVSGLRVKLDAPVKGLAAAVADKAHIKLISKARSKTVSWNVRVFEKHGHLRIETHHGLAIGFPTRDESKRSMDTAISKTARNAGARIAAALESFFRRSRLMSLDNRRPETHLHIDMRLSRAEGGDGLELSEPGEAPTFSIGEGDKAQVAVENWEKQKVYVALLEISPTGLIDVLIPRRGHTESWVSKPDTPRFRELPKPKRKVLLGPRLPKPPYGTYTLKLIASSWPLNLAALAFTVDDTGELIKTRSGSSCDNALECLLTTAGPQHKTRGGRDEAIRWVTHTLEFNVTD